MFRHLLSRRRGRDERVARACCRRTAVPHRWLAADLCTRTRRPARLADGRAAGGARSRAGNGPLPQRASKLSCSRLLRRRSPLARPLALHSWLLRRRTPAAGIHPPILTTCRRRRSPSSQQRWAMTTPDIERIVHGDQRFTFLRPLRPGDIVIATARIDRVRLRAGSELISATVDITGRDTELICTAQATFSQAREATG